MAGKQNNRNQSGSRVFAEMVERAKADLERQARQAVTSGKEAFEAANRARLGAMVFTPFELQMLAGRLVQQEVTKRRVASGVSNAPSPPKRPVARPASRASAAPYSRAPATGRGTGWAAVEGFEDALTLGGGDWAEAVIRSGLPSLSAEYLDRYNSEMAHQQQLDRADREAHPIARNLGQAAGVGAQFLMSPVGATAARGVRLAEATPMIAREFAALGGAGSALGVTAQAVGDVVAGRPSSIGDYAGAAVGGAVDALALTRISPGRAAMLGGGSTALAQEAFNGRMPSLEGVVHGAGPAGAAGALMGRLAQNIPKALTDDLGKLAANKVKGNLGEALSTIRTRVRGDAPVAGPKKAEYLPSGKWIFPDHRTAANVLVEAKYGPRAKLSKGQQEAYRELGDSFRVDHFLDRDIGALFALPTGLLEYQGRRDDRDR